MRAGLLALFCCTTLLAGGAVAYAGGSSFIQTVLNGVPFISAVGANTAQTALKPGDSWQFLVSTYSPFVTPPDVTVDFSELGTSAPATSSDQASLSQFRFGPYTLGADIPSGIKTVSMTLIDGSGDTVASTTTIIVDADAPTIAFTNAVFEPTSSLVPERVRVSGAASGTGSAVASGAVSIVIFAADGRNVDEFSSTNYTTAFQSAFASGATFADVPLDLPVSLLTPHAGTGSIVIKIGVYDQAGNSATTSIKLALPVAAADPCASETCASNVLFLPGIEASRLYAGESCGSGEKLWEPVEGNLFSDARSAAGLTPIGDPKGRALFLTPEGRSECGGVYAKPGDVLGTVGGARFYASFLEEMNALENAGTIADWRAVAYDWRLSLGDLLAKGTERDGKIFYAEGNSSATSTPYIEQTLRELAATSKTGKVTVITHSNGGLVAKALLQKMGSEAASLVDTLVLVGVPQTGAPAAIPALLFGDEISSLGVRVLSAPVAKQLAQNAPMAYHLLPSQAYLDSVALDLAHPVMRFSGDAYAVESGTYGTTIRMFSALSDFLSGENLNTTLLAYGEARHDALDDWAPPSTIEVIQVAGWGDASTVAGVELYTLPPVSVLTALGPVRAYRPLFTEDGDGTVPVASALSMPAGPNVKRYWIDLAEINNIPGATTKYDHSNFLELKAFHDLIRNLLVKSTSIPTGILENSPAPSEANKQLIFFLHSPLTLIVSDSEGNTTGLSPDGTTSESIENSSYGEFGEVKYVIVPAGEEYQVTLHGQGSGTFSLDIQESSGGAVTKTATLAHVPVTQNTQATLTLTDISTASSLSVDVNGDGSNVITLSPKAGETVVYDSSPASISSTASDPISETVSSGGSVSATADAVAASTSSAVVIATSSPQFEVLAEPTLEEQSETPAESIPVEAESDAVTGPSPAENNTEVLQTASAAGTASAQSFLSWLGNLLYTIWSAIWSFLVSIFT